MTLNLDLWQFIGIVLVAIGIWLETGYRLYSRYSGQPFSSIMDVLMIASSVLFMSILWNV